MRPALPRGRWNVPVLILAVAIGARLLLLLVPPLVDVYYYDKQAVVALLSGADPYGHLYTGIPAWLATPGAERVFAYLPGVLMFLAPFGALLDVRLGLIVADAVIGASLLALRQRRSAAAAALFLLVPWAPIFSTSYPNNTLVAMAFMALAILWESDERRTLSAAALGLALASSQFAWLVYPFFLLRYFRGRRVKDALTSALVALLVVTPFALWDFNSFYYDTVAFQFVRTPQAVITPEAFGFNVNPTLSGWAVTLFGASIPLLLKVAIAGAALVALLYRARDLPGILLGSTAFLAVSVFVLPSNFSWWYLEFPFQTGLFWYVLRKSGRPPDLANA